MAVSCENGSEPEGSIICVEFLNYRKKAVLHIGGQSIIYLFN